jgi:hypothetical protein
MRRLIFTLPLLFALALMLGQRSTAQTLINPPGSHDIAGLSSERLVVFEAFLRPG